MPANRVDPVIQSTAGPLVATTPGLNFAGVGNGDYGFTVNSAPPDTNGAVGDTQYVQWVNTSFAVFNKTTGALVYGPVAGNTLWSGFGGGCQTNNDGDPIVQFDKAAHRWILTQFSVSTTPYLQCVAVSTTSDATGTYYRYSFSYGTTQFNDYPKLGVWPDAYYISFNIFNNGTTFAGAKVCAFDRTKMLTGAAATQQCFQLSTTYGGLLPSDLDGVHPAAGRRAEHVRGFRQQQRLAGHLEVPRRLHHPRQLDLYRPDQYPRAGLRGGLQRRRDVHPPGRHHPAARLAGRPADVPPRLSQLRRPRSAGCQPLGDRRLFRGRALVRAAQHQRDAHRLPIGHLRARRHLPLDGQHRHG